MDCKASYAWRIEDYIFSNQKEKNKEIFRREQWKMKITTTYVRLTMKGTDAGMLNYESYIYQMDGK